MFFSFLPSLNCCLRYNARVFCFPNISLAPPPNRTRPPKKRGIIPASNGARNRRNESKNKKTRKRNKSSVTVAMLDLKTHLAKNAIWKYRFLGNPGFWFFFQKSEIIFFGKSQFLNFLPKVGNFFKNTAKRTGDKKCMGPDSIDRMVWAKIPEIRRNPCVRVSVSLSPPLCVYACHR